MSKHYTQYTIYETKWRTEKNGKTLNRIRYQAKLADITTCDGIIIFGPEWCIGKEINSLMRWWHKHDKRAEKERDWVAPSLADRLRS